MKLNFFLKEKEKIDNFLKKIKIFGSLYYNNQNYFNLEKNIININEGNDILLISNKKVPILNDLLKFNNSVNKISIQPPETILPKLTYQNIKNFKIIIYDLQDTGYGDTNNENEIKNYLINGGNIIVTHDHWSYHLRKGCAQLLGAKIKHQKYVVTNKAKILNNLHPIFKSFYDLYLKNKTTIEISESHKSDTIYDNNEDYNKNLLIELEDGKHGEYLLIKEIGKGKIIFWNAGHSYNLTEYEKKLFMNFIYWILL